MTVAEKLAAVEAEAREAERADEAKEITHKRKKPNRLVGQRKGSRRRSTLSPEELASLMGGR